MSEKTEGEEQKLKLVKRYKELFDGAVTYGAEYEAICAHVLPHVDRNESTQRKGRTSRTLIKLSVGFLCLGLISAVYVYSVHEVKNLDDLNGLLKGVPCVLDNNELFQEVFRPLMKCDMCRSLKQVPVEYQIPQEDFLQKYAYQSIPVLVKNASSAWSAMSTFSFQYLKELYEGEEDSLQTIDEQCQFFGYKTEFESLTEVFQMSDERANFKEGEKPWYIGWSNCHKGVSEKLRAHYQRPYFLPNDSESSSLDWLFMGGSGLGAFTHIDYVQRPSWQAQISGKKTWTLIPSPECESVCSTLNVTLHKGDIFVVDTNTWYHSTYIHPGEISITIGSEYD